MFVSGIQSSFFSCSSGNDPELLAIIRKLKEYGREPTGEKSVDKATLRKIEIEKAKQESCVTGKFLTVTRNEENNIQEKKKAKRKENNPKENVDIVKNEKAMQVMGEQIYLVIKMKQKKEKK